MTPLIEYSNNLLVKMEIFNASGNHKVRAARQIISSGIERGEIVPNETTVIEKTGGNFGFGLISACQEFNVDLHLAVSLGFSKIKRQCLENLGATLIGKDLLAGGKTPKEVVEYPIENQESMERKYFFTDQFNNIDSLNGHINTTGPEIANQLKKITDRKDIYFVSCAGTGASLMGINEALSREGYSVEVCLVEPDGCNSKDNTFTDHRFEGMSVGVVPPFIKWEVIKDHTFVNQQRMLDAKKKFFLEYGQFLGNTSSACFHVASEALKREPDRPTLMIAYDHGLWYPEMVSKN
ncbi:hypothetical protein AB835_14815 [Candidatus Endobugula sertula]|uniref:cysteine synthase n=1 Tax=Candidatus Endobugula sertula TaxID=62101 RepID=A0A1D2QL79_9GAMM|nr:hypothetical protein AB835_14815 [Candidatus Endobugula sertula]